MILIEKIFIKEIIDKLKTELKKIKEDKNIVKDKKEIMFIQKLKM